MDKNTILFVIAAALGGFIAGFLLANGINRSEMTSLRSQSTVVASNTAGTQAGSDQTLSPEEIKAKIDEADKNADNFGFQKNLGIGLYRYGAMKQDPEILAESTRILERANKLDPKDYDVLVSLGHAHFDVGFAKRDIAGFVKAREVYAKALAIKPDDLDVRTDMGISYFVQEPPDYVKAAAELEAVGKANPRHDRSMQFLANVYIRQLKIAEAEKVVAKIKEINSSNPAIADLTSQINAAKAGTK